ncbi:MAG TPA: type IV toxin-antitoxin system AbiEi family antitoxin domain-containing protein [Candidatus Limnocylindrales bacterium]|nr:type IV toxin-antitoxin system AbiEi family antitoxin domain-containing protein [Candidatus Limnocylindrales bacterium]
MNDTIRIKKPDHEGLFDTASAQAGYFTAAQALDHGFSSALLTYHTKTGRFVRVVRGLYRLRDYPVQPGEEIVAAWLRQAPDAVVSHESALELLELSDSIADRVHLTVSRERRRLVPQPGVTIHTTTHPLTDAEIIRRHGVRLTAPARTIADVAAAGMGPDQVSAAVGQALRRGLTTPELLRKAAGSRGHRVRRLVEAALAVAGT